MNELQIRTIVLDALRAECECMGDEEDVFMWGPDAETERVARAIEDGDILLTLNADALL